MISLSRNFYKTFLLLALLLTTTGMYAQQSRGDLERKRQNIIEQIKLAQEQLAEIKKNKNASVSEYKALQSKLQARQALISNINQEISQLDNNIQQSSTEVASLSNRLEALKLRYAQSVRYAYTHRSSMSVLAFIFSSTSYNDAMRRMKYVKKLRNYRMDQVEDIRKTQDVIEKKITQLNFVKTQKAVLRGAEEMQRNELQQETNQANKVVTTLKSKEGELLTTIDRNKKSARKLDAAINSAIKREIELARKKAMEEENRRRAAETARLKKEEEDRKRAVALANANRPTATAPTPTTTAKPGTTTPAYGRGSNPVKLATGSGSSRNVPSVAAPNNPESEAGLSSNAPTASKTTMSYKMSLTPEATTLSNSFESNKGRLPWPVERGIISGNFGTHRHAIAEKVMVDNNGIDIQASPGAAVRSVFDGTVTSIFSVPGRGNVVLIAHGVFFTVYSQLASVSVSKGQQVRTKQSIGTVGTDEEGSSMINFQVWKVSGANSTSKMNPQGWIAQ